MTPKGHAIPSKTQLLSYGTPAFAGGYLLCSFDAGSTAENKEPFVQAAGKIN